MNQCFCCDISLLRQYSGDHRNPGPSSFLQKLTIRMFMVLATLLNAPSFPERLRHSRV